MHRVLHGANLETFGIGRRGHLTAIIRHMAKTVLRPGQAYQTLGRALIENTLPDRAVKHAARVRVVAEQKRDIGNQRIGHKITNRPGGCGNEVDSAELGALGHLTLATQLKVGEELDLVTATHALSNRLLHINGAHTVMRFYLKAKPELEHRLRLRCTRDSQ